MLHHDSMKISIIKNFIINYILLSIFIIIPIKLTAKSSYIFRTINCSDGLPDNYIRKITSDADGYIYIATNKGICRYNGQRITLVPDSVIKNNPKLNELTQPFSTTHVSSKTTLVDSKGNVWIYDPFGYGLECHNNGKRLFEKHIIKDLTEDPDGNIWVATNNSGIFILNTENYEYKNLTHDSSVHNSLPTNHTTCVYIDTVSSTVWIGTSQNGVAISSLYATDLEIYETDVKQNISCFSITSNNDILIGYDGGGLFRNNHKIDLPIDVITNILDDPTENIAYIATYGGGIYKLKGNIAEPLSGCGPNSLVAFSRQLYIDSENNLWIGTFSNGLIRRSNDGNILQFSSKDYPIGSDCIMGLEHYENSLYVASSAGVSKVNLSSLKFKHINKDNLNIKTFRIDKKGKPWIATETFILTPDNKKLPLAHTIAMIFDNDNNCWLTVDNGINVVMSSPVEKDNYKYYHIPTKIGINSNSFSKYAIYKKNDGNILAGLFSGYVEIRPNSILNLLKNTIDISSLYINNMPVPKSENLTINSDDSIKITLTTLNYVIPESGRFGYRLLPDSTIKNIDNAELILSKIPSGKYKLQLIEFNSGDITEININVRHSLVILIYIMIVLLVCALTGWLIYVKYIKKSHRHPSEEPSPTDKLFMEKLNQIIERESGNIDFSIEMFASQMGMSRSNLYKKVSQLTEMSPLEYLRDKRIEKGKKMLDDGHTFISQVAYSVGLSPKQFSKFFKEKFGCLPSEYIKPDK